MPKDPHVQAHQSSCFDVVHAQVNRMSWSDVVSHPTFQTFYPRMETAVDTSSQHPQGFSSATSSSSTLPKGRKRRHVVFQGKLMSAQAILRIQQASGQQQQPVFTGRSESSSSTAPASSTSQTEPHSFVSTFQPRAFKSGSALSWSCEEDDDDDPDGEAVQWAGFIVAGEDEEDEGVERSEHVFSLSEKGGSTVYSFWKHCPLG